MSHPLAPLLAPLLALLLACSSPDDGADGGSTDGGSTDGGSTDGGSTDGGSTDGGTSDGGSTDGGTSDGGTVDADGDGWPAWGPGVDPAEADCDDGDPSVTPDIERLLAAGESFQGNDDVATASPRRIVTLSTFCIDVVEVDNDHLVVFLQEVLDERGELVGEEGELLYDLIDGDDEVPERIVQEGDWLTVQAGYGDHPAAEVTWYGAEAYCAWRDQRLPTEAEWERAANGGCGDAGCDEADSARTYVWGEGEPTCDLTNGAVAVDWSHDGKPVAFDQCYGGTTPTGVPSTDVTPEGVYDLTGNLAEWINDWYRDDAYRDTDLTDPEGPDSGEAKGWGGTVFEAKVSRGGSFASPFEFGTTYARNPDPVDGSSNGLGFRCARSISD